MRDRWNTAGMRCAGCGFPPRFRCCLCSLRGRWLWGEIMHNTLRGTALVVALAAAFTVQAADEEAVIVTATRTPSRASALVSDVGVITREQIERAPQSSLGELFAGRAGAADIDQRRHRHPHLGQHSRWQFAADAGADRRRAPVLGNPGNDGARTHSPQPDRAHRNSARPREFALRRRCRRRSDPDFYAQGRRSATCFPGGGVWAVIVPQSVHSTTVA